MEMNGRGQIMGMQLLPLDTGMRLSSRSSGGEDAIVWELQRTSESGGLSAADIST